MIQRWIQKAAGDLGRVHTLRELRLLLKQKTPFIIPRLLGMTAVNRKAPIVVQIEPTNQCNLQCICCARKGMRRAVGRMDMALFRKIVDDAARINIRIIHLYLHGEPTLHPDFPEMVRYIKSRGIALTVATNGMQFDAAMSGAILDAGVNCTDRLIFSVLGHSRETHEAVMRGVDHDRVITNIEGLLRLRREQRRSGPLIEVDYYVMPENHHEVDAFRRHWSGRVDRVSICNFSRQFAGTNADIAPRTRTCKYIWERVTVFHNGDATTCVADVNGERICGNLRTQSLLEVWNSDGLRQARTLHREKRIPEAGLCASCDW